MWPLGQLGAFASNADIRLHAEIFVDARGKHDWVVLMRDCRERSQMKHVGAREEPGDICVAGCGLEGAATADGPRGQPELSTPKGEG